MKRTYLTIVLLCISVCFVQAQTSFLSKTLQSNPYVAPVDQKLMYDAMSQRQQQYDKHVQAIEIAVQEATKSVRELNGINDVEYRRLGAILDSSLKKLNSKKRDYGLYDVAYPIVKHFAEIETYATVSLKYSLPDSLNFTNF